MSAATGGRRTVEEQLALPTPSDEFDVRALGALKALADGVAKEHGKLHVLSNNVGIPGAAGLVGLTEAFATDNGLADFTAAAIAAFDA